MTGKHAEPQGGRGIKRSLNRRILRNTTLNILILVAVCCAIMALSMHSLANSILLDSLQPMARQSAKTVEANIHMLADRMMTIAGDSRMDAAESRGAVLEEAAEIYELYTIALYGLDGRLMQGLDAAPESLDSGFLSLLEQTDNLTIDSSTIYQGRLGITMGMPVKESGETAFYVMGVYKYDTLNDVISSINLGKSGMAYNCMQLLGVYGFHNIPKRTCIRYAILQLDVLFQPFFLTFAEHLYLYIGCCPAYHSCYKYEQHFMQRIPYAPLPPAVFYPFQHFQQT